MVFKISPGVVGNFRISDLRIALIEMFFTAALEISACGTVFNLSLLRMDALGVALSTKGLDLGVAAVAFVFKARFKSILSLFLGSNLVLLSKVGKLNEDLLSVLADLSIYMPLRKILEWKLGKLDVSWIG